MGERIGKKADNTEDKMFANHYGGADQPWGLTKSFAAIALFYVVLFLGLELITKLA